MEGKLSTVHGCGGVGRFTLLAFAAALTALPGQPSVARVHCAANRTEKRLMSGFKVGELAVLVSDWPDRNGAIVEVVGALEARVGRRIDGSVCCEPAYLVRFDDGATHQARAQRLRKLTAPRAAAQRARWQDCPWQPASSGNGGRRRASAASTAASASAPQAPQERQAGLRASLRLLRGN